MRRQSRKGLAFDLAYTLSDSRSDAPELGNSSLGIVEYDPYDLEKMRGPDPYVPRHRFVADLIWDLPFGRNRAYLSDLPGWANLLLGGWTLTAIAQARSGYHLTPFYTGVDQNGVNPANTGVALTDNNFSEAWRPDLVGDPSGPRQREDFFNLAAFALAAPGTTGNTPFGALEGPSNWVVNLGVYKDLYRGRSVAVQFRAVFENAFNHPQFLVLQDSGFLDLSDYLVNGLPIDQSNGSTNTLTEVGNLEGFSAGRVIRLGVRVQF